MPPTPVIRITQKNGERGEKIALATTTHAMPAQKSGLVTTFLNETSDFAESNTTSLIFSIRGPIRLKFYQIARQIGDILRL
jgi:hypothetical protein